MFIKPRGLQDIHHPVRCGQDVLQVVHCVKYLGVHVDDDMSWEVHIDHLAQKARPAIGKLWRHGHGLTVNARRTWHIGMIQSTLCYASNAFYPALSQHALGRLERMAKAGVRSILLAPTATPTSPLLPQTRILPLVHIYYRLKLFV